MKFVHMGCSTGNRKGVEITCSCATSPITMPWTMLRMLFSTSAGISARYVASSKRRMRSLTTASGGACAASLSLSCVAPRCPCSGAICTD